MKKTPLPDNLQSEKHDIIEHINDDHQSEMGYILQAFSPYQKVHAQTVVEVYVEGIEFQVIKTPNAAPENCFIPFASKDETAVQIRFLAMQAMLKLGKGKKLRQKRYFRVEKITNPTPNFLRLTLFCPTPLPLPQAAYACSFAMKKAKKLPNPNALKAKLSAKIAPLSQRLILWSMKHLPKRVSEKLSTPKIPARAYTYRTIDSDARCINVDVFLHGDTLANRWAMGLNIGDVVHSIGERGEHFDYLASGKALLCADETALPVLTGILLFWQNPIAPTVVIEVGDKAEQSYFDDIALPKNTQIIWLTRTDKAHGSEIMDYLQRQKPPVEVAWGALENHGAKTIRKYLRKHYGLSSKDVKIGGYWTYDQHG